MIAPHQSHRPPDEPRPTEHNKDGDELSTSGSTADCMNEDRDNATSLRWKCDQIDDEDQYRYNYKQQHDW